MKKIKNKFLLFIASLFYKTIIEMVYFYEIHPTYNYSGFIWNPNWFYFLLSLFYLFIIIFFSPTRLNRPSTHLYHLLNTFLIVPTLSYFWMTSSSSQYIFFEVIMMLVISFIINRKLIKIRYLKNINFNFFKKLFWLYFAITCLLFLRRGGVDTRAFDFDQVYDIRRENNIAGILGYFVNWTTKVLAPFFFAFGFIYKKYSYILIVIIMQLLMYLSFGNKAFLFSIFSLVYLYWISKRKQPFLFLYCSFGMVNILSILIKNIFATDFLVRTLPYRMLFVPSQIQFRYFDFFSQTDKLYFAETFFGQLLHFDTGYGIPVPILISRIYLNNINSESFANTGIFSDGYANLGYLGMFLMSVLLGFLLLFLDSLSLKISLRFIVCSMGYLIFVLNDTSLLTALMTGGLLLMLLLY